MSDDAKRTARRVLDGQVLASLATLHAGEPGVSMVPFATLGDGTLIVHVSGLSAHTADMLAHPRVSVLIVDSEQEGVMPQAVPRVTIQGEAARLEEGTTAAAQARSAYEARFPDASAIFGLGGFSFFAIRPRSARVIGGFGSAVTLTAADLAAAME